MSGPVDEGCYCQEGVVCPACERQAASDRKRLVRELDVALNGEAGAAAQASLCDLVAQVKSEARRRGVPVLASRVATPTPACTCPSGDGSLRWPCPAHPPATSSQSGEAVAWQIQLADALECFWNPAIEGSGDDRSNVIGGMVQGFQAVAWRLREHAEAAAPTPPATSGLVEVMVDFPQVGIAGPFPVVDGKVSLPDLTMNDLIHHARAGFEPTPPATSGLVEALRFCAGEFNDKAHVARVRGDTGLADYYTRCAERIAPALAAHDARGAR